MHGPRSRVVEPNERLALRHLVAVLDQYLRDDAALEVLNGLAMGFYRNHTRCHRRALEWRKHRPPAEPTKKYHHDRRASERNTAQARHRRRRHSICAKAGRRERSRGDRRAHARWFSVAIGVRDGPMIVPAGTALSFWITSSRDPKAATMPSLSTSTL